eukprot:15346556-Ditylum_brightwellii.AAC.1
MEYHALKNVVCSAAESECSGLFHDTQTAIATAFAKWDITNCHSMSNLTTRHLVLLFVHQCALHAAKHGTCIATGCTN